MYSCTVLNYNRVFKKSRVTCLFRFQNTKLYEWKSKYNLVLRIICEKYFDILLTLSQAIKTTKNSIRFLNISKPYM